jgi:Ca-activated chloride channel family protein
MRNRDERVSRMAVLMAGFLAFGAAAQVAWGQVVEASSPQGGAPAEIAPQDGFLGGASHVLLPQFRGYSLRRDRAAFGVDGIDARVEILELGARTTLEIRVTNPGAHPAEAVLLLPVPSAAAVSEFAFSGVGPTSSGATARLLPREEARRIYDEIVRRVKDPALLEFVGSQLIRSSVFPVPAGGSQTIRLTYEHLLEADGQRRDYFLARSESLGRRVPCRVEVDLRSEKPISMVYSPTHELETLQREPHHQRLRVRASAEATPGPFRLSYLVAEKGVSASLLTCPDPSGAPGGYFLLMAGLPEAKESALETSRREVTVVLDRSGSMAGEKMDQARAAALQVVEGLADGEAFNIIDYSSRVSTFAARPVIKSRQAVLDARAYLAALRPTGGTNVHDALQVALSQEQREGFLGLVLFLTDGLPTVGRTLEGEINTMVARTNVHSRRIFTFGVGHDVNVPLLDRLSDTTRAKSTFVLPGEDVEVKVAQVFRRLYGPVLAEIELETLDESGQVSTRRTREIMPVRLPDLYLGDQLVVLGRYLGTEPLRFRLNGVHLGVARSFRFDLDVTRATSQNAFVSRLWAARKVAFLVDQIRQAGAAQGALPLANATNIFSDPRFSELAEEILRLSTEFGILSEYTSFLATEGTNLASWDSLRLSCNTELERRAVRTRFGEAAVHQGRNFNEKKGQVLLNMENRFWNEAGLRVASDTVQQISDRAFFLRDGQWIDSHLIYAKLGFQPEVTIKFGSVAHSAMLQTLVAEGRQGLLSLPGEILLYHSGKRVLVQNGEVH